MWSPAGGHKGRPYKGLSPPSAFRRRRCPHRPALHRVGAPSILPLFISAFLSCLRRPRFLAEESGGKDGSGRGIPISPAPTPHPLKRPIRGGTAVPPIGCTPLGGAPGGMNPNKGAAAPLAGRFKGRFQRGGNRNPPLCPFFPSPFFGKKGDPCAGAPLPCEGPSRSAPYFFPQRRSS